MSKIRSRRRRRLAVIIAAAAALALTAYAFTAGNTFADPNNRAGDGSQNITGYEVSNIEYQLSSANPANIDSVSFDLDAAAGTVKVKVDASATDYTNCTGGPITGWTCNFLSDPAVVDADQFRVIAVQ